MKQFRKCGAECVAHQIHLSDGTPVTKQGEPLATNNSIITSCIATLSDPYGGSLSSHTCGRKLKGNAEWPHLCGLHVSAKLRYRAKREAKKAKESSNSALIADLERSVAQINEEFGLRAVVETRFAHGGPDAFITKATGNVTLPLDLLLGLLADFERARER